MALLVGQNGMLAFGDVSGRFHEHRDLPGDQVKQHFLWCLPQAGIFSLN
jgi:hypothetical protein